MSDDLLFREVDEEVRREELEGLWKKYGTYIIAACIGVIAAVSGMKGWQYWQKHQAEAGGDAYFAAVKLQQAGKTEEATKAFAALKKNHAAYGVFADFKAAAALAKKGEKAKAAAAYDAIAKADATPKELKTLATVKAGYLLADTAKMDEMKARVGALDDPKNPWRNAARELLAIVAYRTGDNILADRKLNEILADPTATQGARQKARVFLQILLPLLGDKTKNGKS